MSILEYGCGVGRLALPLARRAASMTAVDRSPAMLNIARREAARQGAIVAGAEGAVEIHEMHPAGARAGELARHGDGIVAVRGRAVRLALA